MATPDETNDPERDPLPIREGDVLADRYVVERKIGVGGMGLVLAVRHRDLGELYAMKLLLPSALKSREAVDRFLREARAAARLRSEHVARVSDVGRLENGLPFMVMEYLEGTDLDTVVAEGAPLSQQLAATYVLQACEALAEAHDAGIVHRDLKPANLFLAKRHNDVTSVKVLDFGISKIDDPNRGAGSMTKTSAVLGSPYYMSPEQMRSSKGVDRRTDVWSLGVVLYQLVSGKVPFPGETITEVCVKVINEEPPSIAANNPQVSADFEAVVKKCLMKDPAARFDSVAELAAALAPFAGLTSTTDPSIAGLLRAAQATATTTSGGRSGGPVAAQTVAAWGTSSKKARTVPLAAVGIVGLLMLGLGVLGAQQYLARGESNPTAVVATPQASLPEISTSKLVDSLETAATSQASPALSSPAPSASATTAESAAHAGSATPPIPAYSRPGYPRPGYSRPILPKASAKPALEPPAVPAVEPTVVPTVPPPSRPTATPAASARGHGLM